MKIAKVNEVQFAVLFDRIPPSSRMLIDLPLQHVYVPDRGTLIVVDPPKIVDLTSEPNNMTLADMFGKVGLATSTQ